MRVIINNEPEAGPLFKEISTISGNLKAVFRLTR